MPNSNSNQKLEIHHRIHPSDQNANIKNLSRISKIKTFITNHKLIMIGLSSLSTLIITTAIVLPVIHATSNIFILKSIYFLNII